MQVQPSVPQAWLSARSVAVCTAYASSLSLCWYKDVTHTFCCMTTHTGGRGRSMPAYASPQGVTKRMGGRHPGLGRSPKVVAAMAAAADHAGGAMDDGDVGQRAAEAVAAAMEANGAVHVRVDRHAGRMLSSEDDACGMPHKQHYLLGGHATC
eukprot:101375-Pelagomonas_calceolata.AAC.1